jgi:hypothetical protein
MAEVKTIAVAGEWWYIRVTWIDLGPLDGPS